MKCYLDKRQIHYFQIAAIGLVVLTGSVLAGIGSLSNIAQAQSADGTATLIVDANVTNDDGGTAQASDFTICILDFGGTNPQPQCFPGSTTGTAVTLQTSGEGYAVGGPGTTGGELGYEVSSLGEPECVRHTSSDPMQPGDTYNCPVYFDDIPSPPNVTFKVEDGKGVEISNHSSTTSKSIEIKFTVTGNHIHDVTCDLHGPQGFVKFWSDCTSPVELSKLKKGTYTFTVTVNQRTYYDFTFTWTVK